MKKLSESVWGDIRKKSLGQEERLEDSTNIRFMKPVDLGGSILWADRDLEQQGKDVFTYKEVEELLSRTEWRLPTSEEVKELCCHGKYEENGYSFSNGNQELLFKKRRYEYHSGESYIGWTSTVMGTMLSNKNNRMCVFVMEDGNTSQDDFILTSNETSHYSARLVKDLPRTNESVWGSIRKKSLGQEERQENAFNPDFIDFGDDTTVYWTQKTIDINGNNRFLFDEIKDYNNNGWRLPTFEEVNQINWYDCQIYSYKGDTHIKLQNGEFIIECGDLGNINMWMKEEKSNFMKNSYGYNNNQGTHEFSIKRFNRNYSTLYLLLVKDKK